MTVGAEQVAVSVIVPARNAETTLERALTCLCNQRLEVSYEVIVVDNGSHDATRAIANTFGPPVRVVHTDPPGGPGLARNAGAAHARGSVLAFTDSDCFAEPDWLAGVLRALRGAELVQGAVRPDPDAPRTLFDRTLVVTGEDGWYETANLSMRRDVFATLSGFQDWVVASGGGGPFGWRAPPDGRAGTVAGRPIGEDTIFAWRARRAGYRTAFASDAVVRHAVFPGGARDWIAHRWLWRHMPGVFGLVPELRAYRGWCRLFYDRRTGHFDAALAGLLLTAVTRRAAPLLLALPYLEWVRRESQQWPPAEALRFAAASVAADTVTCVALMVGSVGWRVVLL